MPMYGYSFAALTLVSQKEEVIEERRLIPKLCMYKSLQFYIISLALCLFFKDYIPYLITNDQNLIMASAVYIPVAVIIQIFNFPHSVYKYVLQGVREEKWVLKLSLIVNTLAIALIWVATFVLKYSLTGIYMGIGINYLLLSLIFIYKYRQIISAKKI